MFKDDEDLELALQLHRELNKRNRRDPAAAALEKAIRRQRDSYTSSSESDIELEASKPTLAGATHNSKPGSTASNPKKRNPIKSKSTKRRKKRQPTLPETAALAILNSLAGTSNKTEHIKCFLQGFPYGVIIPRRSAATPIEFTSSLSTAMDTKLITSSKELNFIMLLPNKQTLVYELGSSVSSGKESAPWSESIAQALRVYTSTASASKTPAQSQE